MDLTTARGLAALNNRFYAERAASFSATRSCPWQGWGRVLDICREQGVLGGERARVLDVACGNLRLERFLCKEEPGAAFEFVAVDSCAELAGLGRAGVASGAPRVDFRRVDVLERLLAGEPALAGAGGQDLVACFGFLHHVPGLKLRKRLLLDLVRAARPQGLVAISLWDFMGDGRLAAKALEADARAAEAPPFEGFSPRLLEPGDHFLGWQEDRGPRRYCHSFAQVEADELAASVGDVARAVARFEADGASGRLNRYLVLRRR